MRFLSLILPLAMLALSACAPELPERRVISRTMAEQQCQHDFPPLSDRYFDCLHAADTVFRRPTEQEPLFEGKPPGSGCNCIKNH